MHALPNILIVDDNSTNLLYLEIILRNIPAKLIKALSGAEALSLVNDSELSLAILDVQMPEMNGYELAVLLNENRAENKVPIIFLTANFPENARVLEGYKAGAVDYIVKPLNEVILISKIKIFLEMYWQKQRIIDDTEKLRISEEETRIAKEKVEELNQYQIKALEDERAQISLQVHDELGQSMTALKMDLNWVKQNLNDTDLAAQKIDKMIQMTDQVIKKVQRISAELHPGVLDDLGLIAAVEWYCEEFTERTGIPCLLFLGDAEPASKSLNLALFRIIQESLTNVIRHSQATKVSIQLSIEPEVSLIISDNGVGIGSDKLDSGKSFGLIGMRQRITQCGGTVDFSGSPGNGTSVIVNVPKTN
ncbi:MAG TPA: response regulator [Bacteroidales bacterium]|nr:response regulator [Bacteroidales bacterium]